MTKLLPAALAATLLLAAASARADDAAYDIKIHRPVNVGDKFNFDAELESSLTRTLERGGAQAGKDTQTSHSTLQAEMTIGAVDAKGRESSFHLLIKKCQASKGAAALADVIPAGIEINAVYEDEKATFTMKDGQLPAPVKDILDKFFSPPHSELVEDDMFGTDAKKKIGDSWPVNPKAIARDAKGQSVGIDPDKITGTSKLSAAPNLAGLPALQVESNVEIATLTVPDLGQAKDAKVKIDITTQLPADLDNPSVKTTVKDNVHAVFDIDKNGQKSTLTIESSSTHTETRILAK